LKILVATLLPMMNPIVMMQMAMYLVSPLMMVLMLKGTRLLSARYTGNKISHVVSSEDCTGSGRTSSESGSRSVYRCPIGGSGRRCNRRRLD
jgi:hypothetical protein